MTFDPSKPVQTRDGRPARIICTDRQHAFYSIIALVQADEGYEEICAFAHDGRYASISEDQIDLVNISHRRPFADVLIAWAEGRDVLYRLEPGRGPWLNWTSVAPPQIADGCEWRIKP